MREARTLLRPALAVAAMALLAGCAGRVPPLADATVAPPAGWRTDAGPTAAVDPSWWRNFGDPVLTQVVETALAHNLDIEMAAARIAEARAQEQLARASLVPSLDANATAARTRVLGSRGVGVTETVAQPVFQSAYELDLFGRVHDQVRAARLSAEAMAATRDAAALGVAAAAASGYITLRALDQRLAILQRTLESRAEALRLARDRARAGYASELDFRQAEADYEATAQQVPAAELAISRQEGALSLLLGASPRAIGRGLPLGALARPAVPAGLPSDLLRQRPDIASAEYALAASDASLAVARKAFLPRVNLAASGGGIFSNVLADPVGIWSLGGSILAPLFEGGRLSAGVATAAARRDQAAITYRRTVLTAFREVEDNLAATRRLGEQRARLLAQRTASAAALMHAENRYRAGYSPYLEQLDAERSLLGVELTLVQAEADQLNALVALYQAMGGGWGSDGGATG